jgi:hypothetical protein
MLLVRLDLLRQQRHLIRLQQLNLPGEPLGAERDVVELYDISEQDERLELRAVLEVIE